MTAENQIEQSLIDKLTDLKYVYRRDIRDRNKNIPRRDPNLLAISASLKPLIQIFIDI